MLLTHRQEVVNRLEGVGGLAGSGIPPGFVGAQKSCGLGSRAGVARGLRLAAGLTRAWLRFGLEWRAHGLSRAMAIPAEERREKGKERKKEGEEKKTK
ncbi:hypothetical protein TIFTF001_009876 [Ficus carica]|uniref:Uncharacterized protein n=1 Tax=Ficus carica TaxID=3494 RepID=A0AA87ZX63_FICCA|nr:hypothetical protein TIFTF001_009876 [Ficus carica]